MKHLIFFSLIVLFVSSEAAPVSIGRAISIAVKWHKYVAPAHLKASNVLSTYTMRNNNINTFYIINFTPHGFVLVSADDILPPVLGFSFTSGLNPDLNDEHVNSLLDIYNVRIYEKIKIGIQTSRILSLWEEIENENFERYRNLRNVPSLFETFQTSRWGHWYPYTYYTPYQQGNLMCVGLSLAQLLKFHQHPVVGKGSKSYQHYDACTNEYVTLYVNFEDQHYDYLNMPFRLTYCGNGAPGCDDPEGFQIIPGVTQEQIEEVAKLIYHCAVSVNTDWDMPSCGDTIGGANFSNLLISLKNYFFYPFVEYLPYIHSGTKETFRKQLDGGYPILFSYTPLQGYGGRHAIVIDGYMFNDYFHFVMGRGGYSDGYYYLFPEDADSLYQYIPCTEYEAIINLYPLRCEEQPFNLINPCNDINATEEGMFYFKYAKNNVELNCNIKDNITVHILAKNKISLKQGFRSGIHTGQTSFRLSINDSLCDVNELRNKKFNEKEFIEISKDYFICYPNPFTSSTTLTFYNKKASNVRIYLLNAYGIIVRDFANKPFSEGLCQIDINGNALPDGLYLCIIESSDSDARKVIKIVKQ